MAAASAAVGGGGAGAQSRGPGDTTARRTGRGGTDEDDIIQGRARDLGVAGVEAFREAEEDDESPGGGGSSGAPTDHIRIVMRFAAQTDDLLISGGLKNGQALANAPAVVDVPVGDGHVVMFSFNPFWRGHTHGSYALLFNTLMHHDALSTTTEEMVAEEEPGEGRPR